MTSAISTANLSKDYGSGRGLFGLDLEVQIGEIFGYLGPNGAGKTTTIKLLMGMIHPSAGSASVLGMDAQRKAVAIKRRIGYQPGELPQFGGLRGREIVSYLGGLRGGVDAARVKELASRFDLDLGQRFREYSRGNKQKLAIVLAFMHRPDLLVLDEPSGGLDPLNQQEFYQLVQETRKAGATIFLSSHILSEVEHVCDRIGIIRSGRLVQVASLSDLHEIRFHHVEITFAGDPPTADLLRAAGLNDPNIKGSRVTGDIQSNFESLMKLLGNRQVLSFTSHEPSLEEVFLTYYKALPHSVETATGRS